MKLTSGTPMPGDPEHDGTSGLEWKKRSEAYEACPRCEGRGLWREGPTWYFGTCAALTEATLGPRLVTTRKSSRGSSFPKSTRLCSGGALGVLDALIVRN